MSCAGRPAPRNFHGRGFPALIFYIFGSTEEIRVDDATASSHKALSLNRKRQSLYFLGVLETEMRREQTPYPIQS